MRSNARMMKEFREMPQWLDVMDELTEWEGDVNEIQNTSDDEKELFRCQGRKEAINHLKNIPEVLQDTLEAGETNG